MLSLPASVRVSVVTPGLSAGDPAHGGPELLTLPALFLLAPGDHLSAAAAELGAGLVTTGATFVAAVVPAVAATPLSRGSRRPPRPTLILPGFFALTVGSLGTRGLTALAGGHVVDGLTGLPELVPVVAALAVGPGLGAALVPDRSGRGEPPGQPN
ncbi:hypothetical protein [Streptomyces sp. NPDC004435]|uniref:hypothetical protein n=1 Tax=Streptomyces sp. NPDC004435 TaxID=3364701 RepID=UPI00369DF995